MDVRVIDALLSITITQGISKKSTQLVSGCSYRRYKCLSYQHTEDISKGNRLPCGLLCPESLDVVGDVLGKQQPQRVTTNSVHQLLVDVLWTLIWKVWMGVQSGHVPTGEKKTV